MPGIAIISMDMYNDASKLVDENFDGKRISSRFNTNKFQSYRARGLSCAGH